MSATLEDLRSEWMGRAQRLEQELRITRQIARDDWIERQRERVRSAGPFRGFEIAVWIAALALLGRFLATHYAEPLLFATAALIDAWVIATGVTAIRQQQAVRNLDYGLPLTVLQSQVESLRIARIRAFNVAFLTGQVVWWIPFFVVFVEGLFGVNLYSNPWFVQFALFNVALGVAAIPVAIWVARRYGERLAKTSAIRHIADSIAGRDIAVARDALEKLRRFGAEP
ncbi:MAG TPA: hypothetical protein VLT89_06355 [Usitatibacter sp.]|nr:hypothetical protein [Usitatibacter sp.]